MCIINNTNIEFMDIMDDSFEEINYDKNCDSIDYDNHDEKEIVNYEYNQITKKEKSKYIFYGQNIEYDKKTMEYYHILREQHICPLSKIQFTEKTDKNAFKFYDQWDPYTGNRTGKDPYGPLYFDVATLCHYYYLKRLDHLWIEEIDEGENGGLYEAIYDNGVGAGINFTIKSRGSHPERYLFRIPIPDCYLTTDHNNQIPTFGPMLTNLEVDELNTLLQNQIKKYYKNFYKRRLNISLMKQLYDDAINDNHVIPKDFCITEKHEIIAAKYKLNCDAVDRLRKM